MRRFPRIITCADLEWAYLLYDSLVSNGELEVALELAKEIQLHHHGYWKHQVKQLELKIVETNNTDKSNT